ncbi:MAG TPA: alpha-glucosidase, partial [Lachnospiraceae bacterium]|nr:alpha-glucosidase [Lachnospiraceae bacterium]
GYSVYDKGVENGYFATTPEGEIYVNAVWPGDAVYPDFGKKEVRDWWGENQQFLVDKGVRGVWNDMNEPASFRGELPQDVVFTDEDEKSDHARMHNVYGHNMAKATYEGLKQRDGRRPFVITRACYAGTQKYSTAWTGDNHSIWAHLQMAIPQLCNLGMSGMSFVGTDVGGFGSDCTKELMCRWVEVGCF